MSEKHNLDQNKNPPSSNSRVHNELKSSYNNRTTTTTTTNSSSSLNNHYRNPPETKIPDPETLRDQWRFAIRQYSRWYSQAWGTAILAGVSFFALGWIIKGSNPLPSFKQSNDPPLPSSPSPPSDVVDKDRR